MASAISVGEMLKLIHNEKPETLLRFEGFPNGQVSIRIGYDAPFHPQFLSDDGAAASFTSYEVKQPQKHYKYPENFD